MDKDFIDILQKLIAEQGKEALLDESKCKALLADYTKGEFKKESRFLLQVLKIGVQREINTTKELAICKKQQVRLLLEEYFIVLELAIDVVDTLALVLRGDTTKTEIKSVDTKTKQTSVITGTHETSIKNKKNDFVISSSGYEMVFVPGGSFQMGDTTGGGEDSERPVHTVTLSAFSIGKYEVTQSLYQSVTWNNPSNIKSGNLPVHNVYWYEALDFCNKLSEKDGLIPYYIINKTVDSDPNNQSRYDRLKWLITQNVSANGYRLPTEAEWEYAAKGGNGSPGNYKYAGSNDVNEVAWYEDNSGSKTHVVGTKKPNSLNIYDMSGNVLEWCWDWYGSYSSSAQTDPQGASSGSGRVCRGGYWLDSAEYVRSAERTYYIPSNRDARIGFRIVRPLY